MGAAFGLAPAHHPPAGQRPLPFRHDRALGLAGAIIYIQHHPVAGGAQPVGAGGVGEQGGVAAAASRGV